MTTTVTSEQFIKAKPSQVYYALTHAIALHEWLCDYATVAPSWWTDVPEVAR